MRLNIFRYFLISILAGSSVNTQAQKILELQINEPNDFEKLGDFLADALIVGMGESTHGTHEFFISRMHLFQYLVTEHGFNTFFLEADYTNCLPINNYINGSSGDAKELVKAIALWPWMTLEMVELVNWMRNYNLNNNLKLSFIGVDVQKVNETVVELNNLLGSYSPESLINLKKIKNQNFYTLKKASIKKNYLPVLEEISNIDMDKIENHARPKYTQLLRHFNQIITTQLSKNSTARDHKMAENILYHLQINQNVKGFFWAHNMHIANFYNQKKERGVAGGVIKHYLNDKYISIGQEFYQGTFNVYSQKESKNNGKDKSNYVLGSTHVGPAAKGSLAANFRELYNLPLFIPFSELPENEEVYITNIGARYIEDDNPKSIWRFNHHGRDAFDALLLIENSSPTKLLID